MTEPRRIDVSLFDSVSGFTQKTFLEVPSSDFVSRAAKKMLDSNSTEAIVCDDSGNPVGIITERDVLYRVVAAEKDPKSTRVIDVMSSPVQSVEENTGIAEAMLKMIDYQVRRLGVTRNGELVGIITQNSIVSKSSSRKKDASDTLV